jgi:hypothetical protein
VDLINGDENVLAISAKMENLQLCISKNKRHEYKLVP